MIEEGRNITEELENLIPEVLKEMLELKDKKFNGEWRDAANNTGIIISAEALLSFFTPAMTIPKLQEPILKMLPLPVVKETLKQILTDTEKGFFGSPYIDFTEKGAFEEDQDFLDSACFVVSTLLYAKKLYGDKLDEIKTEIDTRLVEGLRVIKDSHIGKNLSWSWGTVDKPAEPFLYFTWTASETLPDLFPPLKLREICPSKAKAIIDVLEEQLDSAKNWLEDRFIEKPEVDEEKRINKDLTKSVIAFTSSDRRAYYNLYATIALMWTKSAKSEAIEKSIDLSIKEYDIDTDRYTRIPLDFRVDTAKILTEEMSPPYYDRTFLPLMLKCLAMYVSNDAKKMEQYKEVIYRFYDLLLDNRVHNEDYRSVWDKYATGTKGEYPPGYSIYYTERAIEALCRVHACFKSTEEIMDAVKVDAKISVEEIARKLLANEYFISELATRLQESGTSKEKEKVSKAKIIGDELREAKEKEEAKYKRS